MAVLGQADGEMRLRDIQAQVEQVLGGAVSLDSVGDYLRTRSKGARPRFIRTGYGRYQLLLKTDQTK
jgi:hypothetical protein